QPRRDLLVAIAPSDELEHLALARRQLVQLGIALHALAGAEGVEDEAGEAGREDGVTVRDAPHRVGELLAGDRLRDVAAGAGAEEGVVVDEHDTRCHAGLRGSLSSTSVPAPASEVIVAVPPARAIRPSIDSASPRRSRGTSARSKPAPRSRTKTLTSPSAAS